MEGGGGGGGGGGAGGGRWLDGWMDGWNLHPAVTLCPLSSSHICRWLLENLVETIIIGPLVTVCGRYLLPRIF